MKTSISTIIITVSMLAVSLVSTAMPGPGHNSGTATILDTPAESGGAMGVNQTKAKAVHDWMDNPSRRLGPHHNRIRHNPVKAARALSGTGKIDPAKLNIARMHKIQDVAHNVKPVDGWKITAKMRQQASQLLKHVEAQGALPKRLPIWVDQPGPLLDDIARNTDSLTAGIRKGAAQTGDIPQSAGRSAQIFNKVDDVSKTVKVFSKCGKLAGPVGIGVEAGIRGKVAFSTEQAYREGKISETERNARHTRNGCAMGGGMAGAAGGAKAGALAGGAIGACFGGVGAPIGAGIGGIAGAIGGGFGGDWLGGKAGEHAAKEIME